MVAGGGYDHGRDEAYRRDRDVHNDIRAEDGAHSVCRLAEARNG